MNVRRRLSALLLALLLCCLPAASAYGYEAPDTSRTGSVSVTMLYGGKPAAGGTLTLYRVGEISLGQGGYSFAVTGDFAESGIALDDISSYALAEKLAKYAVEKELTGTTEKISSDGTVVFSGLKLGLYLIVQKEAAEGYEAAKPFLISVPAYENGAYVYDVDATPKVSTSTGTKPPGGDTPGGDTPGGDTPGGDTPGGDTPGNDGPGGNEPGDNPSHPVNNQSLPQTGQLNWPVPVMAAGGLFLILIGWALCFGKKENE